MAPRKRNFTALKIVLIVIMLALLAGAAYFVKLSLDLIDSPVEIQPPQSLQENIPEQGTEGEEDKTEEDQGSLFDDATEPEPTEPPQPVTASISAQGDLLIHGGIIKSCNIDGAYDFESNFR